MRVNCCLQSQTGTYLKAKQFLEKSFIFNRQTQDTARSLLRECITPLVDETINHTIKVLYNEGALTRSTDCRESKVTSLGTLAVRLPCELKCAKLILYGYIFGCLNECIVMAAALACEDLFWSPQRYASNVDEFMSYLPSLRRALESRTKFDQGIYSEPIMCLMVYKEWLRNGRFDTKRWCKEHNIYESRMHRFELEVNLNLCLECHACL
jgi:HrpA-like RNA helicase